MRAIRQQMPEEAALYLADQRHVPYGSRSLEEVRAFSEGIARFLLSQGAKLIAAACNTASAAALHHLRQTFPDVPFVGMEPAVKPAAEYTRSGVVGVLATPATFQGALYASVVERFASGVELLQHTCPGLVAQIERGDLDGPETRAILAEALLPMLVKGIDTVVLGCTHYPFVIPLIEQIVGPEVRVIDPAPAVARQIGRLLEAYGLRHPLDEARDKSGEDRGPVRFFTSGEVESLQPLLLALFGEDGTVRPARWEEARLVLG